MWPMVCITSLTCSQYTFYHCTYLLAIQICITIILCTLTVFSIQGPKSALQTISSEVDLHLQGVPNLHREPGLPCPCAQSSLHLPSLKAARDTGAALTCTCESKILKGLCKGADLLECRVPQPQPAPTADLLYSYTLPLLCSPHAHCIPGSCRCSTELGSGGAASFAGAP